MPCPDLEKLDRFVSGELDEPHAPSISDHLAGCEACRNAVDELRRHAHVLPEVRSAWAESSTQPSPDVSSPPELPGYTIVRTIHHGGQGVVYLARQRSTHRLVAVKLLLQGRYATRRQRHRFEREIDLAAPLDHPNIVTVFDSGTTDDNRLYLVMRYVDGYPLDTYARQVPRGVDQVLALFVKIAEAVRYAHQRGVLHRDLKPSNILIDADGEPHLLDFGLAKPLDTLPEAQRSLQTQAGEFVGTLAYAAPEQVGGDPHAIDTRSDVYSLGLILYELLTGEHPYPVHGTLAEIVENITAATPVRASAHRGEIGDELDTILAKALAKEKERRYQSVADLLRDLERYQTGRPIEAKGDSTWYVARKLLRRHRVPVAAGATVVLCLILATIVSFGFWRRAAADRTQLQQTGQELRESLAQVELEADKVTAINDFLVGMLGSAHPVRHGKDVTVRAILDGTAATIDDSFADQPLIEAEIRTAVGNTYRAVGELAMAEPHLLRAVELRRELLGDNHTDTLESVAALVLLYFAQGRFEEALPMARNTLERRRHLLGEEHLETLRSLSDLGLLLFKMGRYEEAEPLWINALELRRRALGEDSVDSLLSLTNLAWLYIRQGRHAEAEPLALEAVERHRRTYGLDHLGTLRALGILGVLYEYQGRYAEAEPVYLETLEAQRRVLGEDHPETLITSGNLAWLYIEQDRLEEAEVLQERNFEVCREVLGEEHPGTLFTKSDLAALYDRQGRTDESERLNLETLETRRRTLGEEHPDTLASMNNLAVLYYKLNRLDEAEALWREALQIRRRVLGEEHPETLRSVTNLALLCHKQQQYDAAEPLFLEALEARQQVLGPIHPHTLNAIENLTDFYGELQRFEEAEAMLLRELQRDTNAGGSDNQRTRKIKDLLVRIYEAWGKPDKAAAYRDAFDAEPAGDS